MLSFFGKETLRVTSKQFLEVRLGLQDFPLLRSIFPFLYNFKKNSKRNQDPVGHCQNKSKDQLAKDAQRLSYRILKQWFKLFILLFSHSDIKLESMSKDDYFGIDYFEADADASLHFLLGQHTQRKPSYDELIPEDLFQDEVNPASYVTCESPKHKAADLPTEERQEKKVKKRRQNTKTGAEGRQRGHWTLQQNKRYHWFLQLYSNHFVNKHMRRMDKIFKTMERFVQSREAEQCRSHHQKMEKKHGTFLKILQQLRNTHYGSPDSEPVMQDIKSNGLQCTQQFLSQGVLQSGICEKSEKSECMQSEKQTINQVNEVSPSRESFLDPLLQFQCDADQFLEGLIS